MSGSNGRKAGQIGALGRQITRRDFIGSTLIGTGAALLDAPSPARAQELGSAWTGYGGTGDYKSANGDTADVVRSAHRIRDGVYDTKLQEIVETGETYDVVIVGGGFAGLTAMYEFHKRNPQGVCLLIDNHPIFGGFAKSNEFDVDGFRLAAPQASVDFTLPVPDTDAASDYWRELGLPDHFEFAQAGGGASIKFPRATVAGMFFAEQCATVGYYFQRSNGRGTWIKDIWDDNLKRVPWPEALKRDLLELRDRKTRYKNEKDEPAWLDSMSYADFVTQVMRLSPDVLSYFTPIMDTLGSPQVSAYFASVFPGVGHYPGRSPLSGPMADRLMSFPGGNATLLRHFVKAIFPDSIQGPRTFESIANGSVNLSTLDRPGATCRMRLRATAVRVSHEGEPYTAEKVSLIYEREGRLYRVASRSVVLAIGSWVSKHIATDLPPSYRRALDQFLYGPTLIVNVALRNWRFLDRLGFAAARWFDGFGFYSTIRQPMLVGNRLTPFHPDKPIVMTFYVPLQHPALPLAAQGPAGRGQLYATSYVEYERQIVGQMQQMFASGGFDARRDIAGIVLNRWGHARLSPPPGFFFGKEGVQPPLEVLRQPFGRIVFGNSELSGLQSWPGAVQEGRRAITQALSSN